MNALQIREGVKFVQIGFTMGLIPSIRDTESSSRLASFNQKALEIKIKALGKLSVPLDHYTDDVQKIGKWP